MIETEITITQKEDIDCEITINEIDGTALNMSAAGTLVYFMVHDGYNNVVAKFKSGAAATGWYLIDGGSFATGILKFKILSEITKNLVPGKYYGEVLVRFSSGSHPDDFYYDLPQGFEYLFTIKESQINKLASLP